MLFLQGPINAQMLAQRQREILSQHLRQRQMQQQQQQVQQRTLMMRGQGLSMTPSMVATGGIPATMSNPRIPQANAQQFPFPPNYGTGPTCPYSVISALHYPHCLPSIPSHTPSLPSSPGRRRGLGLPGVLKCNMVFATLLAQIPPWALLFPWAIAEVQSVWLFMCIDTWVYAYAHMHVWKYMY